MTRKELLVSGAIALALFALPAGAQDLADRPADPPPAPATATPEDQVDFSAGTLEYDSNDEVVTATGDVRMFREGSRLRADKVVWNRKTGAVNAVGNIAVVNPEGDTAYGDSIELTDTLKDGVVENMLVVLKEGGRLAADRGIRDDDGVMTLERAAYTPCPVVDEAGCPKEPSWKITAVKVVYNPERKRIYYNGARFHLFGLSLPLPPFSNPVGGDADNGFLSPDLRYNGSNGLSFALPYYFALAPNRGLTVTPRVFTSALPLLGAEYRALNSLGAYRVAGYGTYSKRNDTAFGGTTQPSETDFRGYLDASGKFQLSPEWSVTGSFRIATDKTFLRRYEISNDDRLRNMLKVERITPDSYLSITGWATQSLRLTGRREQQPIAVPEIDYRRRIELGGGRVMLQLNTLALTRTDGQDTQRAFASARWDLRRLTNGGQEILVTAVGRGDVYNTDDAFRTLTASYRGKDGFSGRVSGAVAVEMRWPLIGQFGSGTQRITPRIQLVGSPHTKNFSIPNEDSRAVDLDDSNLFSLNRFPGFDRIEDGSRVTYGVDWALALPSFTLDATVGQSYRLDSRPGLFPDGTGLTGRLSDIVGRTEVRFRDFVSLTHRYRLDKEGLAVRRNEIDATVGTKSTYALLGYLRLNRNIGPALEDLQDREEVRVGGRVAFLNYWSVFGSATVDLTDRAEDRLSQSDGFDPVRTRLGVAYEDDCLRLGLTWRRDYERQGDARRGNSFLLSVAFRNLGR